MPQESSVFDFSCLTPENTEAFYLKFVGIPSLTYVKITKNIDLCHYDENNVADQDKWQVDSDGETSPFFDFITDLKEFDDYRDKPVSMGGLGANEV